jgi:uncharacterized protein (TIGR01777 family)
VLVTGSSGLIGRELVTRLGAEGHDVTRLVRRPAAGAGEVTWDPQAGTLDVTSLEGHDAAVHLAGAGIGDHRWSDDHKRAVLDSRVQGTGLLARTLAQLDRPPRVFISGSAVGYYGYESDQPVTETSPKGNGFLADTVAAWEEAAGPAEEAGIRTVRMRSGVVLTAKGGALKKQLLPFKLGVGGTLGTGRQWLSWISLDDEVAAIIHLLTADAVKGPVNVTSPEPVTNREFTATLGRVLKRPTFMPVPTPALHALFGKEMTKEMLLGGQRVLPEALEASGYRFTHPTLEGALRTTLGR